jgi:hypothetical protein
MVANWQEIVRTNSAAVPLFGQIIPLIGRKIPLLGGVGEFASNSNGINHLRGRIWPPKGRNQRFLLFFPVKQGNSVAATAHSPE